MTNKDAHIIYLTFIKIGSSVRVYTSMTELLGSERKEDSRIHEGELEVP